ncbi:hypothetical protein [Massilia sp. TN1-12]|uniref:hypothetical protein n=1 Tax=Massilia paldalensis TaxID=3377675 RepID=UPI00384BF1ED
MTNDDLNRCAAQVADIFQSYGRFNWWVDRLHNMQFIEDQKDGGTMHQAFYLHAISIADKTGFHFDGLT